MDIEFGTEAEAEYQDAAAWYAEHGWMVLERFADEVARMSRLTAENPWLWPEVEPGVRRAVLDGFPFSLVYTIQPERVFVLAFVHHSHRPNYWRGRRR